MFVSHLECPKCSSSYASEEIHHLCSCGSPLLVKYDLEKVREHMSKEAVASRPPDLWRYRELLFFLVWRDVKVRYKQSVLGAAWAIIQPFFMMRRARRIPTGSLSTMAAATRYTVSVTILDDQLRSETSKE